MRRKVLEIGAILAGFGTALLMYAERRTRASQRRERLLQRLERDRQQVRAIVRAVEEANRNAKAD